MPIVAIYEWDRVNLPGHLTQSNILYDMDANHPNAQYYDPAQPTWTGHTYTYQGGAPAQLHITDDDPYFEDGYTETGAPQVLNQDISLNGKTYSAGDVVQAEFSLVDASGVEVWVIRIGGENVGFSVPAWVTGFPAGSSFYPVESRDGDPAGSSDNTSSSELYSNVACFTSATPVDTPSGAVQAGRLRAGDRVMTLDHGPQPVLWTGRSRADFRGREDGRRPIRFEPGALGPCTPSEVVDLSPQHRVLLTDDGGRQMLAPACGLLPLRGVRVRHGCPAMVYVHVLMPRHEILTSNAMPVESLFPGQMALAALSPPARSSLRLALQQYGQTPETYGDKARPTLTRREAAEWARTRRHAAEIAEDH